MQRGVTRKAPSWQALTLLCKEQPQGLCPGAWDMLKSYGHSWGMHSQPAACFAQTPWDSIRWATQRQQHTAVHCLVTFETDLTRRVCRASSMARWVKLSRNPSTNWSPRRSICNPSSYPLILGGSSRFILEGHCYPLRRPRPSPQLLASAWPSLYYCSLSGSEPKMEDTLSQSLCHANEQTQILGKKKERKKPSLIHTWSGTDMHMWRHTKLQNTIRVFGPNSSRHTWKPWPPSDFFFLSFFCCCHRNEFGGIMSPCGSPSPLRAAFCLHVSSVEGRALETRLGWALFLCF